MNRKIIVRILGVAAIIAASFGSLHADPSMACCRNSPNMTCCAHSSGMACCHFANHK